MDRTKSQDVHLPLYAVEAFKLHSVIGGIGGCSSAQGVLDWLGRLHAQVPVRTMIHITHMRTHMYTHIAWGRRGTTLASIHYGERHL